MPELDQVHWVIEGICQVCEGDAFKHPILFGNVLWCNAIEELINEDED